MQIADDEFGGDACHTSGKERVDDGTVHKGSNDSTVHTVGIAAILRRRLPDRLGKAVLIDFKMEIQSVAVANSAGKTLVVEEREPFRRGNGNI